MNKNIALCYDFVGKRLYCGFSDTNDCIFQAHDKKGYKNYKISIPNEPVEIVISSNLHYQGASFLFAKIIVEDKLVLNFHDKESLYLVSHNGLETFQVQAGDWNELFNIIIKIHDNLYFINETDIKSYFDELDNMISCEEILVYRNKTDNKPTKWNGTFLVLLHTADVLNNIIQCKDYSLLANNSIFSQKLLMSCRKYLQRFSDCFSELQFKENDSRVERLSKELLLICNYVERNGKPLEFAKLLIQ